MANSDSTVTFRLCDFDASVSAAEVPGDVRAVADCLLFAAERAMRVVSPEEVLTADELEKLNGILMAARDLLSLADRLDDIRRDDPEGVTALIREQFSRSGEPWFDAESGTAHLT